MKQPKLFDVPQDAPTRKQRIEAFKKQHEIETHNAGHVDVHPWSAMHRPSAFEIGEDYGLKKDDSMFEYVSQLCRLLDEAGVLVCGNSETEAIRLLCQSVQIPCDL